MAEAAHPWPEHIHQSFNSAKMQDLHGREESVYYGPFTRLLYTLFSLDGPYEIIPQIKSEAQVSCDSDNNPGLVVVVNKRPVFFMEIIPPAFLASAFKREEADEHIRRRFRDLRQISAIPTLHGISAFGTQLSFYEYDSATSTLQPERIPPSLVVNASAPPITRWDCDILKPEGAKRLRDVVKKIKEMV